MLSSCSCSLAMINSPDGSLGWRPHAVVGVQGAGCVPSCEQELSMGSDSMSRETRKYRALENFTNLFWTCTSKMYGRSPLLVNVVAAVFLLQLSAFTTTVESASARGEVILALKRIAVIEFSGSNVAQNSLLNHTQIAAYDFEQHLGAYPTSNSCYLMYYVQLSFSDKIEGAWLHRSNKGFPKFLRVVIGWSR